MNATEALQAYDRQLRRNEEPPAPGWTVDRIDDPAPMLRLTSPPDLGWGDGVFWCDLDEANADAAIAATIDYFRGLGRSFEWKHFGYDRPADLADRLRAAGLEPDEEESLVIGEVAEVRARLATAGAPEGVTIRRLREDDGGRATDWAGIAALKSTVWDEDMTSLVEAVSAEHANDPAAMSVWLAEAPDGQVVSAAWVRLHAGTEFASLWGGSTLAEWRGRGIYKALVSRRAEEAAQRGYRYLQVDASDDSRPILERLGLVRVTTTTPWQWQP